MSSNSTSTKIFLQSDAILINGGGQDKYQETGIISYNYPFYEKKNDISVYKACITANIVKVSVVIFSKKGHWNEKYIGIRYRDIKGNI